jgi:hypothetical protein
MEDNKITHEYVVNYAKSLLGEDAELTEEQLDNILGVMQKYPNNPWWENKDSVIASYYQNKEEILIMTLEDYQNGLEKLLGRPVFEVELNANKEKLQEEATKAIELYLLGEKPDESEAQENYLNGVRKVEDEMKKRGINYGKFNVDSQEDSDDERDENGIDNSGYDGWLK